METKYWLPKHRLLELKHFCLQYPSFVKNYLLLTSGVSLKSLDPTSARAMAIVRYRDAINLIQGVAAECGPGVLQTVTDGSKCGVKKEALDKFYYKLSLKKGL